MAGIGIGINLVTLTHKYSQSIGENETPRPSISGTSAVNESGTISLTATPMASTTYTWYTTEGAIIATTNSVTLTPSVLGTNRDISITVQAQTTGKTISAMSVPFIVTVTGLKSATPTITGLTTLPQPDTVTLSVTPISGATYAWTTTEGSIVGTGASVTFTPTVLGTNRTVTISCRVTEPGKLQSDADTHDIAILGIKSATPTITSNTNILQTDTAIFRTTAVAGATYTWSSNEGTLVTTDNTSTFTPATLGTNRTATITLRITESGKYISDPATFNVSIQSITNPVAGIANLVGWYNASSASDRIMDGSFGVSQLNDLSGNSRHLTQGTSANRPIMTQNYINGRGGLNFDGTNDYMVASNFDKNVIGQTGAYTLFFVGRLKSPDPTGGLTFNAIVSMGPYINATTDRGKIYITQPRDAPLTLYSLSQGTGAQASAVTPTSPFCYHEVANSGLNGALNWYTNNTLRVNTPTTATARVNENNVNYVLCLGGDLSSLVSRFGVMDFGEMIIFNRALTTEEQTSVYTYLQAKWGI
jgi:hypothetical protein